MNTLLVKRTVLAGIAALTITAAGLGVVGVHQTLAAPSTPTTTTDEHGDRAAMRDKFMAAVVANLNSKTGSKIQVDDLKNAFAAARTELGGPDHAAGSGDGHPGGGRGGPGGEHGGPGGFLKPAADVLGLTPEELWLQLSGKSLNDVAGKGTKSDKSDAVASALTNAEYDRIAKESQQDPNNKWSSDQVSHARAWAADRVKILMAKVWTPRQKPGGFDQRDPQQQTGGFGPRGFRQQADNFQFQQRGPHS